MRLSPTIAAVIAAVIATVIATTFSLFVAAPVFAQGWTEYSSQQDFFTINFPGEPEVRDITYDTPYFITLPGRVYGHEDGPNRYSVTVVNYADAARRHAELVVSCRAELGDGDSCNNHTATDLRSAMDYATWNILQRKGELTHFVYYQADRVEGRTFHLTNSDGSRTFAAVNMHENRLYILEGTVDADSPPPMVFQQSLGFLDQEGRRIRYATTYSNGFPAPPRDR